MEGTHRLCARQDTYLDVKHSKEEVAASRDSSDRAVPCEDTPQPVKVKEEFQFNVRISPCVAATRQVRQRVCAEMGVACRCSTWTARCLAAQNSAWTLARTCLRSQQSALTVTPHSWLHCWLLQHLSKPHQPEHRRRYCADANVGMRG